MDGIMEVIWAANYTPYDPLVQLFFPVLGFTQEDKDKAIAESKDRFWKNHQSDASSKWFYVVSKKESKTVGCAQWLSYTENQFSDGPPTLQAPWWPEGDYRAFCERFLSQVYKPRASWMTRPFLGKYN